METNPDYWCIIKIPNKEPIYKIFATWKGGYLGSDSWKANSGIEKVIDKETYYEIIGFSGSIYKCYKTAYGTTSYGNNVLVYAGIVPMIEKDAHNILKSYII